MTYTEKTNVVIVGAGKLYITAVGKKKKAMCSQCLTGIFGMSSALWMLETGKYSVTILDKSEVLPAPDAASTGESCLVYELKKKKKKRKKLTSCF